ncbi:type II secretion system protein GspL [Duganella fentianensis]|uniref:type II secretion system protein GspL n=1 Tax=Duganella fentianensis TaxID=2692177 RepID=UPI0032B27FBB
MSTLFIRYPAKASIENGAAQSCAYALVGDAGHLQQQGAAALGSLADLVASARRVVLLLAAADVTLLQVTAPPLSPARLKAALPGLVEEQVLGDPADCVLAAGPADAQGVRTVAVAQRAWLERLAQALLAQGAHSIALLPAQLCLPYQPGTVTAALGVSDAGYELAVRAAQSAGFGLTLSADALAALQTLRALAGSDPVTLYLPAGLLSQFAALQAGSEAVHGITVLEDQWVHWVAAIRAGAGAGALDLAPALGTTGNAGRQWQRWRWPLRIAVAALLVNVAGLNLEWLGLRRAADSVRQSMQQTFKAAYPNEPAIYPLEQMRKNVALAKADGGEAAADEFTALSAALGEALAVLPRKDIIATLEYRDRALFLKVKPNMVDSAAQAQLRAALAARQLDLAESSAGNWQVRVLRGAAGGKP